MSDYQKSNKLHIVAVTAVIRNPDGKFLVVKRGEHEVAHPGLYSFPGGKVEDNETTEEALVNEVAEETGLTMRPGKVLLKDASFVRPDGQSVKVLSFLVQVDKAEPVTISEDFSDYKWISAAELTELPHIEGLLEELAQAEKLARLGIDLAELQTASQRDD